MEVDVDGYHAGAVALMASAVLVPIQLLVALQWPQGYSVTDNAISDLGVTSCGQFSEQGQQVRDVCSRWHPMFNAAMVASGVLVVIGAVLLHGWWNNRSGRAGTAAMAVGGVLVSLVGLAPWDKNPGVHDGAALRAVARHGPARRCQRTGVLPPAHNRGPGGVHGGVRRVPRGVGRGPGALGGVGLRRTTFL